MEHASDGAYYCNSQFAGVETKITTAQSATTHLLSWIVPHHHRRPPPVRLLLSRIPLETKYLREEVGPKC